MRRRSSSERAHRVWPGGSRWDWPVALLPKPAQGPHAVQVVAGADRHAIGHQFAKQPEEQGRQGRGVVSPAGLVGGAGAITFDVLAHLEQHRLIAGRELSGRHRSALAPCQCSTRTQSTSSLVAGSFCMLSSRPRSRTWQKRSTAPAISSSLICVEAGVEVLAHDLGEHGRVAGKSSCTYRQRRRKGSGSCFSRLLVMITIG
jgi:hypothetical protein